MKTVVLLCLQYIRYRDQHPNIILHQPESKTIRTLGDVTCDMCARIVKENAVECGVQHIPEKGTKSVTRCLSPKILNYPGATPRIIDLS